MLVLAMSATIAQCQGPNCLYSDTDLCFTTYIYRQGSKIASSPTAQLLLQSRRCTDAQVCTQKTRQLWPWAAEMLTGPSQQARPFSPAVLQWSSSFCGL